MNKLQIQDVTIEWLGHASFRITNNQSGRKTYIDPFKIDVKEPADIILITHSHYDHFSQSDINKIIL